MASTPRQLCGSCGKVVRRGSKACKSCGSESFVEELVLTDEEKRLLLHPPTEDTWLCEKSHEGLGSLTNSGKSKECWLCRAAKPKKATSVWPVYLGACEKVGAVPGVRWREHDVR